MICRRMPARRPDDRWFFSPIGMGYSPELIEAVATDLDRLVSSPASVRVVTMFSLAEVLIGVDDYDRAEAYLIEADDLAASLARERAVALISSVRGTAAARQGDFVLATQWFADEAARGVMPRRI
jgi:hypothetical protein